MRFEKMPTEVINDLLDEAAKNGGVTVAHCGLMGYESVNLTSGYAVGGYSSVILLSNHDSDGLCASMINNLIHTKNQEAATVKNEYLGLWVDEIGYTEIEFSRVYDSLDEAMKEAKKLQQRYIFDFKNNKSIKV